VFPGLQNGIAGLDALVQMSLTASTPSTSNSDTPVPVDAVPVASPWFPIVLPSVAAPGKLLKDIQSRPPGADPDELLRNRFLCRGGGMLLVGPTGIGKSTFAMQFALCCTLGRPFFGIQPARPLRVLIIQSENDEGDLAEMRDGVLAGLGFRVEDRDAALANIVVVNEDSRTGLDFCGSCLAPALAAHRPDLVVIDPSLAYLGGEAKSQKDVGTFLRSGITPWIRRYGCGAILVHHTNKPPTGQEKAIWQAGDFAYLGSGSAELANWARAVLAIRSLGSHDVFELCAAKRGGRLAWVDDEGERSFTRLIAHAKGNGFFWRPADDAERPEQKQANRGRRRFVDPDQVLELLHSLPAGLTTTEWMESSARQLNVGRTRFHEVRRELEQAGRISKPDGKRWITQGGPESPERPESSRTNPRTTEVR
jgi:hypothetical protein